MPLLFEARIIKPILRVINKNIDYLTKPENLPQLAKLGFMYNILYYYGRICYGYFDPLIKNKNQCDENPAYKIDICDVGTKEQFDLIYDAWCMHVTRNLTPYSYEDFSKLITEGKVYSDIELLEQQHQKTMDDYVRLFTNKYSFLPNKKAVYDYLLCNIDQPFEFNNGVIIDKLGFNSIDNTFYYGWENSIFPKNIQKVIDKILGDPDVKIVLDTVNEYLIRLKDEEKEKNRYKEKEMDEIYITIIKESIKSNVMEMQKFTRNISGTGHIIIDDEGLDMEVLYRFKEFKKGNIELDGSERKIDTSYKKYYPISNSSLINKIDENTHISYIKAAFEICKDIYDNTRNDEKAEHKCNINFMNENMSRYELLLKSIK